MYSLQWMGAVRIRFQTADKNITILMTPAHQLTSCEVKSFLFMSPQSKILICWFVQWKVSSESGEKYAQIKHSLWAKTFQTSFYVFATSNGLKLKVLIYKTLIDELESCGLIHVILNFSKSVPLKKQTHLLWWPWGWVHFLGELFH